MVNTIALASLFVALVAAAPLEKRDMKLVKGDITDLMKTMTALNTAIDNYKGGVFAALPVQSAESAVETSILKASTDVTNEPTPVNEEEAKVVLAGIKDLDPMIKHATDQINLKADSFGASKSIVKNDMVKLKGYSDTISTGLVTKAPDSLKAEATAQKTQIDGYFDNTIKLLG